MAEEIESLGRQEKQQLTNRLEVLLGHLLKWEFQVDHRSKSWLFTIEEQRRKINKLLNLNPSLKPFLPEAVKDGYEEGLALAIYETSLEPSVFPKECLYSLEEILDPSFFPGIENKR